jgi:hypothetical protein
MSAPTCCASPAGIPTDTSARAINPANSATLTRGVLAAAGSIFFPISLTTAPPAFDSEAWMNVARSAARGNRNRLVAAVFAENL